MARFLSNSILQRLAPFAGLALLVLSIAHSHAQPPTSLSVSPTGNDSADGSPVHPFASLERARQEARALKTNAHLPQGGLRILITPGQYRRTTPFLLSTEDSGTDTAPIIWKADPAGAATLDYGTHLAAKQFHPVEGEDLKRLAPEATGHVWRLDLAELGIQHRGPYPINFDNGGGLTELYLNGTRQPLSRWPNNEPARIERILDKGSTESGQPRRGGTFVAREDRVSRWPVERGVWLEGYWRVPWDPRTVKVSHINPSNRELTLADTVGGGIGSKYGGAEGSGTEPWTAINLLEEIDQPGEWAVDFQTGQLYWWPPENWTQGDIVLTDSKDALIRIEKASHIHIEGLLLENGLSNGIEIRDSHHIEVAGCRLRNLSGSGIVVQRGELNTIRSCDISELGQSGIVLSGGNRAKLTPCGHLAENNHIHHIGLLKKTYAPGILVGIFGAGDAVGCRVAHNFIHDVPHGGIQYGGNDHLFEYNEISHAVVASDDMGAFYTTNDWTSCGNLLRYNFVHHSPNAVGFYMDDGDGGDTIFGNVAYEMQSGPSVCGGHYNTVRNNLVVRCKRGLFMDARGISRAYDKDSALFKKLKAVPFADSPWKERFPFLLELPESDTRLPQGNAVNGNIVARCEKPFRIAAKPEEIAKSVFQDNLDLGTREIGFADETQGDLTLRLDSVIFKEMAGFEAIPFLKIGLYPDEFRTTLPARQLTNPTSSSTGH